MTSWNPDVLSQIAGRDLFVSPFREDDVTFEPSGDANSAAIDAADEAKYPGSSAVPVMQADGPKAAAVRIAPR